jgi:hypothetical protein
LKAGDDRDRPGVEGAADASRRDIDDPGFPVRTIRYHAGLGAGERAGLVAQVGDGHGQQRHGDPLAGGQQHVQLAARRQRTDLLGQIEQLIRRVAHGGHHDDDVVARLLGRDDPLGDPLDAARVGDGGATVLLHDKGHG